jgi:TPR repeat protein
MVGKKQGVAIVAVIMVAGVAVLAQGCKGERKAPVEAVRAEADNPETQYQAGLKALGQGNQQDGAQWLEKAADAGHVQAMLKLGDIHSAAGDADGDAAIAWYEKAANAGNIEATRKLGIAYATGLGRNEPDPAKALPPLETAAKADDAEAQLHLGQVLIQLSRYDEAITWLTKAGEAGQSRAWYLLGEMYYQQEIVKQDIAKAFGYYAKGAEAGNDEAQLMYSFFYLTARGTKRDKAEAYKWVLIADEAKTPKSRGALKYIEPKLSDDDKTEGQQRADAWKAANPTKVPKPAK